METTYKTIIVTFKESIDRLNGIFDAPQTWGASTLKEWVDADPAEDGGRAVRFHLVTVDVE